MVETLCPSLHSEAPYDVVLPVGHAKQVSDEVAPAAELYRPATQSMQESAATTADAYFPASQSVQLEDAAELTEPASHAKQVSDDVAPVAELYRPATQSVQVSAAEVNEYFPASQLTQYDNSEDPGALEVPASQAKQVPDDAAPVVELYRPAAQSVQDSEDSAAEVDEYLPVPQSRQLVYPEKL